MVGAQKTAADGAQVLLSHGGEAHGKTLKTGISSLKFLHFNLCFAQALLRIHFHSVHYCKYLDLEIYL